jgi:hypothetical protein
MANNRKWCKCGKPDCFAKSKEWRAMFYSLSQLRALGYTQRQCKELLGNATTHDNPHLQESVYKFAPSVYLAFRPKVERVNPMLTRMGQPSQRVKALERLASL